MQWSRDVQRAAWIGPRIARGPIGLVPDGYGAYVRLLHPLSPAGGRGPHGPVVRWADIAAWSGEPLVRDTQFHEIALPRHDPGTPPPAVRGPDPGNLAADDVAVLVEALLEHTSTPASCWFGVWEGSESQCDGGVPSVPDDLEPVRLPGRTYYLLHGSLTDLPAFVEQSEQTPHLWWPEDRSWFVASDIHLDWTCVGGNEDLAESLLDESRVEAQTVHPGDEGGTRVRGWLLDVLESMADELLESGSARFETVHGTLVTTLARPTVSRGWGGLSWRWVEGGPGGPGGAGGPGGPGGPGGMATTARGVVTTAGDKDLTAREGPALRAEVLEGLEASVCHHVGGDGEWRPWSGAQMSTVQPGLAPD